MRLPIFQKLRKEAHKAVALAQDLMIIELYNAFPDAVLHGGTGIWRVYSGNRFSEDIDMYLPAKYRKSEAIKIFIESMKAKGFIVNKFREKENSIFSTFTYQNSFVRFEAVFEEIKNPLVKPFELSDGTFTNVYTLSAEDLILEKISAYTRRKKVRDLYDIFFLLNIAQDKSLVAKKLKEFLKGFEPPSDFANLKVLIVSGAVPNIKDMLGEIRKWAR